MRKKQKNLKEKLFVYWIHELAWHKIDYGKDFKIKYVKQRKKKRIGYSNHRAF